MQDRIRDALQRNAFDDAAVLAREWAAAEPHDVNVQHLLAFVLAQGGHFEPALDALDRAIGLAPERPELHLLRATLLARTQQMGAAQQAVDSSLELNPNLMPAYLAKIRFALMRGDLAEAESLSRTASRVSAGDPRLALTDATIALHRGDADRAIALATSAADQLGEEPQLFSVLATAYVAKQHWAFAEQAFRRLASTMPDPGLMQPSIARMLQLQGRPDEAVALLQPLLGRSGQDDVALARMIASCQLQAGRDEQALPHLLHVLDRMPADHLVLQSLLGLWKRRGDLDVARTALDAALATHPQTAELWAARLSLEERGGPLAAEVVRRWNTVMPDHLGALEAELLVRQQSDDHGGTLATARQICASAPGRLSGEQVLVEDLLERDPEAALSRVDELVRLHAGADEPVELRGWKGWLLDRRDRTGEAVATWREIHQAQDAQRLALPAFVPSSLERAASTDRQPTRTLLVWGAPGSGIERVVDVLGYAGAPVLADRFGSQPPGDPLQWAETAQRLADRAIDAPTLVAQWRDTLRRRGAQSDNVIDWIPWWDNVLAAPLRGQMPHGRLLTVIRDPRDMLLDWLCNGAPLPLRLPSPAFAATWLAQALEQVAELDAAQSFPCTLLRVDDTLGDPRQLAAQVGEALGAELRMPEPGYGQRRLPPGRWRAYGAELGDAFAVLTPVAVRLGYSDT